MYSTSTLATLFPLVAASGQADGAFSSLLAHLLPFNTGLVTHIFTELSFPFSRSVD
uniref:Uncharacterized protein n=1 Tax=Arundo donax TaxID=35708 RepID=A0A0A9DF13_ARUDO